MTSRAAASFFLVFLVLSIFTNAAPSGTSIEAESLVGAPKEQFPGAGPANAPMAVVFDQSVQDLKYSAGVLPAGPVWVILRIKSRDASGKMIVATGTGSPMTVQTLGEEFLNLRVPAISNGSAPLTVQMTWVSGVILIDRIDFVQATDAVPLPVPDSATAPSKIFILHGRSGKAREQASSYHKALVQQGLPAQSPQLATAPVQAGRGDAAVVICDNWNWEEPGVLKYLPGWVTLEEGHSASVVYKAGGLLGDFPVLGRKSGETASPSQQELDFLRGQLPPPSWVPEDVNGTAAPAAGMVGNDSAGLAQGAGFIPKRRGHSGFHRPAGLDRFRRIHQDPNFSRSS
jgi:hypothetical protein